MSKWKQQVMNLKRDKAKPPVGYQSIEQIADEMEMGTDAAQKQVNELIKRGRVEVHSGHRLNEVGQMVKARYYRLASPAKEKVETPRAIRKRVTKA